MAGSRKRAARDALTRAIADCLVQLGDVQHIAVAISGGLDSTILAVHAAELARQHGFTLHGFHIHHGLQALADQWQSQTHDLALTLGIACHSLRVAVAQDSGLGIEAAARTARYAGLAQLAQHTGVRHVLLGHHRDDQAETVLLRLLRGSGPQGLAAMRAITTQNGLTYVRPFLELDRCVLAQAFTHWQRASGWQAAQDPSNMDARHTRSALRTRLVPALDARWPAWRANLARHAQLSAQINDVLQDVIAQDFASLAPCPNGVSFSLAAWRTLSPARQALVLRHWLARHGLQMPSEARLRDVLRQLRGLHALGHDRHMRVRHGCASIACEHGRVILLNANNATKQK